MVTLCWLRRDLRLTDHRPLGVATQVGSKVYVCFVFDTTILKALPRDDRRVTFIYESLRELDHHLRQRGSGLIVRHGDPLREIPKLAKELEAKQVYAGLDYEPQAKKRDEKVGVALSELGITLHLVKDQVIFGGDEILNQQGQPYRVFTPYKKAWLARLRKDDFKKQEPLSEKFAPYPSRVERSFGRFPTLEDIGFKKVPLLIPAGSMAGEERLKAFKRKISTYESSRNFPAMEGTSTLSPHLRFGTVSIRSAVRFAVQSPTKGYQTWLSELIWREFYQMILDRYPHVVDHAFQKNVDHLKWPGTRAHFKAWCEGRTGYPIVDAAMRDFNQTGWMHNRLRMIVASFLTKDLLVHWQWGEAYFERFLLDFDLASNNGGWQWSASTGVDAQPYFRIFNPTLQAKRFDPEGEYIRKHVPERAHEKNRTLFQPQNPIVDHSTQSMRAMMLFRGQKGGR